RFSLSRTGLLERPIGRCDYGACDYEFPAGHLDCLERRMAVLVSSKPPCVVHEDEHLLVVNKPAGLNTHSPSPFAGEGIYEWLRHREPRWADLAIIHRLDKETSGVLVFGKTALANRSLTEQFTARTVKKKYLLLTDRVVPRKDLTVRTTLLRVGERYASGASRAKGEWAETRFTVSATCERGTLLEAEPMTGRTHQIRVHAAEHGFPILGDALYGGTAAERVFLHAAKLSLKDPATENALQFDAPCDWQLEPNHGKVGSGRVDALRDAVIEPERSDAFRLIHGASDGWPGFY